jgi:hypothetical protein
MLSVPSTIPRKAPSRPSTRRDTLISQGDRGPVRDGWLMKRPRVRSLWWIASGSAAATVVHMTGADAVPATRRPSRPIQPRPSSIGLPLWMAVIRSCTASGVAICPSTWSLKALAETCSTRSIASKVRATCSPTTWARIAVRRSASTIVSR